MITENTNCNACDLGTSTHSPNCLNRRGLGASAGSAIRPWDRRAIAKMLRKEAVRADEWAYAHKDSGSVDAKGTPKRESYRRKAAAYRKAAKALESLSQNPEPSALNCNQDTNHER